MKRHTVSLFFGLFLSLAVQALGAEGRYEITLTDIESVKGILDDPTPLFAETDQLRKWMSQEVWKQTTYDVEEMKEAWAEVVGFRSPDVVGKIAPEIVPGRYTWKDKERYPFAELMPEYYYNKFNPPGEGPYPNHVGNFTEIEVVPTAQRYYSLPVAEATKKYIGTVKQDEQGYIIVKSYVAGYPFPRPSGRHKAMQILYNLEKNYSSWESFVWLETSVGVNARFKEDHRGSGIFNIVRTSGRVRFPPYGFFDKRAEQQGEYEIALYRALSPRDLYGLTYLNIEYADPRKPHNLLAYVNILHHFEDFSKGIMDTKSVIFFISGTLFFLFLAVKVLESKRWRG